MHLQRCRSDAITPTHVATARTLATCHIRASRNCSPTTDVNATWLAPLCCAVATVLGAVDVGTAVAVHQPALETELHDVVEHGDQKVQQAFQRLRRSSPFEVTLNSIVNIADTLSLATDQLLEITAAEDAGFILNASKPSDSSKAAESSAPRYISSSSLTVIPQHSLLHEALAAAAVHGREQLQEADPANLAAMGVAHRVSQQALAIATEALKLAALFDSQEADQSYQSLLQQIEEAACSVATAAADIAQPGVWVMQEGQAAATEAMIGRSEGQNNLAVQAATPSVIVNP